MPAIQMSHIDAVTIKEILPRLLYDYNWGAGPAQFAKWHFTGFKQDPATTFMVGHVTALRLVDNKTVYCTVRIDPASAQFKHPTQLITEINELIESAIEFVITFPVGHIDGILCENTHCGECYS